MNYNCNKPLTKECHDYLKQLELESNDKEVAYEKRITTEQNRGEQNKQEGENN